MCEKHNIIVHIEKCLISTHNYYNNNNYANITELWIMEEILLLPSALARAIGILYVCNPSAHGQVCPRSMQLCVVWE